MANKEGTIRKGVVIVRSVTPDVCYTPMGNSMPPIPYTIVAQHAISVGVAETVHMNGAAAFVMRSSIPTCMGDASGVGGGVKSGTFMGVCEPMLHSTSVRAEGSWIVRHADVFYMNNKNTFGKAIYDISGGPVVALSPSGDSQTNQSNEPKPAPSSEPQGSLDPKTGEPANASPPIEATPPEQQSWSDWAKQKAGDAWEGTKNLAQEYKIVERGAGAFDCVTGALGAGAAGTAAVVTAETVVGAIAFGGIAVNQADMAQAGCRQAWTGLPTETLVQQGAAAAGMNPETAGMIQGMIPGVGGKAKVAANAVEEGAERLAKKEGIQELKQVAKQESEHAAESMATKPVQAAGGSGLTVTSASPKIEAHEITGKTRDEIRQLANEKGLKPKGKPDPVDGQSRKWKDPVTNEERLRLDRGHIDENGIPYDHPTASVDHVHGYEPGGTRVRDPVSGDHHFPTK